MVRSETKIRVRYAEVDRLGRANAARYFEWFELGRSDCLRGAGMPYGKLEEAGVFAPVSEAACRYLAALGYDDLLRLETTLEVISAVRLRFEFKLFVQRDGGEVLSAEGHTENAIVDPSGRPQRLVREVLDLLRG